MKNLTYLVLALLLISCHKEVDDVTISKDEPNPPAVFEDTNLTGTVTTNGIGVEDVLVEVNGKYTTTDSDGKYQIEKAKVGLDGSLVKFSKDQFLINYGVVYPNVGNGNVLESSLLPIEEITRNVTISNQDGGHVENFYGYSLQFPPGALVTQNEAYYGGNINVYGNYIDPTDFKQLNAIPGDGRGVNASGEEVLIMSYGMMDMTLLGDDMQSLKINPGDSIEIGIRIPKELKSDARDVIPLWHFDIASGRWKEEGLAIRDGDNYYGKVGHFSWWNFGFPVEYTTLKFRIVDKVGNPVTNQRFNLRADQLYTTICREHANRKGEVFSIIPIGMEIEIQDICGNGDEFIFLGTFNEDTDLGDVNIMDAIQTQRISGKVLDCNGQPLPNCKVIMKNYYVDAEVYTDDNGEYFYEAVQCDLNQNMTVLIEDMDSGLFSLPIRTTFGLNGPDVEMDDVVICNDQFEWFNFWHKCDDNNNGVNYVYESSTISARREEIDSKHGTIYIEAIDDNSNRKLELEIEYSKLFDPYLLGNKFNIISGRYRGSDLDICSTSDKVSYGFAGWEGIQYIDVHFSMDTGSADDQHITLDARILVE